MMDMESLRKYEEYIRSFPLVTPSRERQLSALILGGSGVARDRAIWELVNGNLKMVLSLTRKYRSYQDYLDIVFDGNLGLVRAATDFDSGKGRFTTHATPRIRTAIRDGMGSRLGSAYVPRTIMAVAMKVKEAIGKSDKTDDVLAAELGVKVGDVVAARLAMLAMLDAIPMIDKEGRELEIPDQNSPEIFDELQKKDLLALVTRAATELGLTKDELVLVSEAHLHTGITMVPALAKKGGTLPANIRYRRSRLIWEIRHLILSYVGSEEYRTLSAHGLPASRWNEERRS